jgi:3-phenylpropionate/trans-cinnamate dioxygenase ferredoxin subunit
MADWTDVGPVSSFTEGEMRAVQVERHDICVLLLSNDEAYAMRNSCPHAAAKICAGRVLPDLVAETPTPGAIAVVEERTVVACPWHGWEFDPRDGRAVADSRMRLKVWPAKVQGGRVLVQV